MKLKIGQISQKSGVPASTIRYYVNEGLLPRPEKINEKMAYYDESCIDRLLAIQELKERKYYPLHLIKNILRRMDDGLNLTEAETIENAVFFQPEKDSGSLLTKSAFLAATGLTEDELAAAERFGLLIPFTHKGDRPLYNREDVRAGREGIRRLLLLGMKLPDLSFWKQYGGKIVEREMELRRKMVTGKTARENIAITAELTNVGNFYRDYILRRLFQKRVEENIQKSLNKKTAAKKRGRDL